MTIKIISDTIGGTVRQDGTGIRATRVFRVTGIRTAADYHMLIPLTLTGIPSVGDKHPRRSDIAVLDREVALDVQDPNGVTVTINYGPPDASAASARVGDIKRSLRTELIQEETIEDINGTRISTTYVSRFVAGGGVTSVTVATESHRIEVQRPSFSLVWDRIERELPIARAFDFNGTVNSRPWAGKEADTWLMNIEATQDNDARFRVSYVATYNANTWQATINHQVNGVVPFDVSERNGIETYQVYPTADFNKLKLPT